MANTTVRGAQSIHGVNPQALIENVIRQRIYESSYWKEHCFALTAESVIDRAIEDIKYIGGTYANTRPTIFLCLTLKLLQIQPQKEIILEYLSAEEFKYLRALAIFYIRLTFNAIDVYETLEPLLDDFRKLRHRAMSGAYSIVTIDDFVDQLLTEERVCDIQLPRLTQRTVFEDMDALPTRKSKLSRAMQLGADEASGSEDGRERYISPSGSERGSGSDSDSEGKYERVQRSVSPSGSDGRYISRSPTPDRYISRSPSRSPDRFVSRSPTRSPSPDMKG